MADTTATLRTQVAYYNTAVKYLRDLNGKNHRTVEAGLYDLYSRDFHDCIDVASYGCNILRACGIPTVVEYNISYRNLPARHYHCCVYNDSLEQWQTFNAETSLPGDGDWAFAETMNVYRITYAAQQNTPHFLKQPHEFVPQELRAPCVIDVTSHLKPTVSVTLPCTIPTSCNLAYLATFQKEIGGVIPVTWGHVNHAEGQVLFSHVIPNILYFPIYYPTEEFQCMGEPFYVTASADGTVTRHSLPHKSTLLADNDTATLLLTRKYPRKPALIEVAERLVGGKFVGANQRDFSDAVTLLELTEPPQPYFLTYGFTHTGRYQYYRFEAPPSFPNANISMLEWIAPAHLGYTNVAPPSRPHLLSAADTLLLAHESKYVKLLDAPTWAEMSARKSEYDGNMQTAPRAYPSITLRLEKPQCVTHVRFSPRNADNGIQAGDEYELYYWQQGWQYVGSQRAQYEYLAFDNVPPQQLYWLKNLTRGREELPFVIDKGEQAFLYYQVINTTTH